MGGKKRGLGHFLIKNRNRILTAATAAAVFWGLSGVSNITRRPCMREKLWKTVFYLRFFTAC